MNHQHRYEKFVIWGVLGSLAVHTTINGFAWTITLGADYKDLLETWTDFAVVSIVIGLVSGVFVRILLPNCPRCTFLVTSLAGLLFIGLVIAIVPRDAPALSTTAVYTFLIVGELVLSLALSLVGLLGKVVHYKVRG